MTRRPTVLPLMLLLMLLLSSQLPQLSLCKRTIVKCSRTEELAARRDFEACARAIADPVEVAETMGANELVVSL